MCDNNWATIDATSFWQRAATANQDLAFMGIKATNESAWASFKKFSSRNATATMVPKTTINHTNPKLTSRTTDPAVECVAPADVATSGRPVLRNSSPALVATFADSTGTGVVSATFEYYHSATNTFVGSETVSNVRIGEIGVMVPEGLMLHGESYRWRVRATDDSSSLLGWYGFCEFTVDATQPVYGPEEPDGGPTAEQDPFTLDTYNSLTTLEDIPDEIIAQGDAATMAYLEDEFGITYSSTNPGEVQVAGFWGCVAAIGVAVISIVGPVSKIKAVVKAAGGAWSLAKKLSKA